ncbi:nitroreductase family protein [Natronocalculus amylovorans]|uniref:Nitroreductase family protein n=1 Tax=Natronocalculus amylovorans TaxID=2917812 RepID=A0AAE3FXV0_9EURY|nr:nitroreductase family protein [Natronocalculus amylovorans]MCL9816649.1 nitroreductase family protein [Natronocalculus amylovorans]NUE01092.1 nitroreductase family protein [Halorubraceae archaeon YAN]
MEFETVAGTRRSVHQYAEKELSKETLEEIFADVRNSPSSYNLQPWEFLVVQDTASRELLKENAYGQAHVADAPAVVVVLGNLDPAAHAIRVVDDQLQRGDLDRNARDKKLDRLRNKSEDPKTDRQLWTTQNVSLATMTLMHAAWARGIASCPMGGFDPDAVTEQFAIPDGYEPLMLVTLGYPRADADDLSGQRKFRRPVSEFVHYETFDPVTDADIVDTAATDD